MDDRLVGWARAVKSRQRRGGGLPPLWLFTDQVRIPDLAAAVQALPRGLCGVVFRHDDTARRAELAQRVWRICRNRRLAMVVAGDGLGFTGPGMHLRRGHGTGSRGLRTASAHGVAELVRSRRNAATLVFLSQAYQTASHPGHGALGAIRWAATARVFRGPVFALGGIDGASVRRLPRWVAGAGAIGALLGGLER